MTFVELMYELGPVGIACFFGGCWATAATVLALLDDDDDEKGGKGPPFTIFG